MHIGISTASLFGRYYTEEAVKKLNQLKVDTTEVFLESYSEYSKKLVKGVYYCSLTIDGTDFHETIFSPQDCKLLVR